ncbi:AMP-binding protein [Flammeovirga kamogawensis]|uniref:AMP-binding protein n=1 Tax=Flammeovirga kamogawensis TaxID=373891 RepID=A0ABX8GTV9_9BACT|nr:AMP-binding protein [Flammeovirga kamogawensis]MBB6459996.1 O-succinylbenzoic acid--CoA ligase [Flammeovirga kamogawensis]QWG06956.1 AMP-binding protein [Flammeovirga kamogawensis]TRX68776.1 AMP-binding protein [Flammeovirga kamogawensis]
MYLHIAEKEFKINDLRNGNFQMYGEEHIDNVLIFCFEWLNGKEEFTMQSSGSTGNPKTIVIKRNQMEASAKATAKVLGLKENDNSLICINTEYIGGRMMLVRALEFNLNTWIISPSSHPLSKVPTTITFDFIAMVPLQVQSSIENELSQLQKVKKIIIGGAPISNFLKEQIILVLKATAVYMTYGMTETVSHIALKKICENSDNLYHTIDGVSINVDERNCLNIIAPMSDYQKVQTNDVVKLISTTSFEWLGRVDNIINSGGVKIQAEKIESNAIKILSDMGYSSVSIFVGGIPHSLLGEQAILFIEGISLTTDDQNTLLQNLSKKVGKFEVPKQIISIGSFIKTDTMKIKRKETINNYLASQ